MNAEDLYGRKRLPATGSRLPSKTGDLPADRALQIEHRKVEIKVELCTGGF